MFKPWNNFQEIIFSKFVALIFALLHIFGPKSSFRQFLFNSSSGVWSRSSALQWNHVSGLQFISEGTRALIFTKKCLNRAKTGTPKKFQGRVCHLPNDLCPIFSVPASVKARPLLFSIVFQQIGRFTISGFIG